MTQLSAATIRLAGWIRVVLSLCIIVIGSAVFLWAERNRFLPDGQLGTVVKVFWWLIVGSWAISFLWHGACAFSEARDTEHEESEQARLARAPLVQRIKLEGHRLQSTYGFLPTLSPEQQRDWIVRRFREVLAWEAQFTQFASLASQDGYDEALREAGVHGQRFTQLWQTMSGLYHVAKHQVSPVDRVEQNLDTQEQIALRKAETVSTFERFRRERLAPLLDSENPTLSDEEGL